LATGEHDAIGEWEPGDIDQQVALSGGSGEGAGVTNIIMWRGKEAYSDAMKHNVALSHAEVSLERDGCAPIKWPKVVTEA
jgi:hypothetical protein